MNTICLDTETFYSKDFSVVELGYDRYCRHELFDCYLISVSDGKESWAGHPRDFNFDTLTGQRLLSHNLAFDGEVALAEEERGRWPKIRCAEWHCTANMAAYLWSVRSLKDAVWMGLGELVDKGVRDRAKGKTEQEMKAEGWYGDMLKYGISDAVKPVQLWEKYGHLWPEKERRLSNLTIEQGRRGMAIDVSALRAAILALQRVIVAATNDLPWIARGRPPASPLGIAEECRAAGIPTPPVKAHEPEAAAEWEETYAPRFRFVMAVKNLRKAKKTLATLETIQLRLRPDDTIAFSTKYFGAHTGRWAGDGGFNVQNQSREPLFIDPSFSFVFEKPKLKELGERFEKDKPLPEGVSAIDVRGLIVARPGKKLCPSDLAAIEPRCLSYAAGDFAFLKLLESGQSPYEAYGRLAPHVKWSGGEMKKEAKGLYQMMKIEVLMYGYQAGWEKAIAFAAQNGIDLTEKDDEYAIAAAVDGRIHERWKTVVVDIEANGTRFAWKYSAAPDGVSVPFIGSPQLVPGEKCIFVNAVTRKGEPYIKPIPVYGIQAKTSVNNFRAAKPGIVALWETLQKALEASVGSNLVVELPSGRCLTYRNVKREGRKSVDKETGREFTKWVYTGEIGGRRYVLYGGLLAENFTQAFARDVFADGFLRTVDWLAANNAGHVLFTVHDEEVPEVEEWVDKKQIEKLMSVTPDWASGLPVAAEAQDTLRYKK